MTRHPYPGLDLPQVSNEGGSSRITIPSGIRDELALETGEQPEAIKYDPEEREVLLSFPPKSEGGDAPERLRPEADVGADSSDERDGHGRDDVRGVYQHSG